MTDNTAFLKSELAYRTHRIKTGVVGRRRGHVRTPWSRRPADASDDAR
ncbi:MULTISPECIES: hypothetical protein [Nocardioides]|uniref:Uncharacterized protein n=1 Tax=Nocardioides lianchengensis TaxID=1045774 RepID=A0A1G7AG87_9ACTN|nr:hypothetical protein [Nocardioides lianchengensis]NYG13588.1 hypothetical protein [Nocardioides lianchengensis]SDE13831.1 hypothetical protein SAMN05421872_115109 [Nocardioides lianchengensis]